MPRQGPVQRALWAIFLAYFTYSLIISTLTVALPRIAADLDGMRLFSWALALPGLASALSTLLFGKLSDLYGRRPLLLLSLAVYLLGVVLAAVSGTFEFLIFGLSVVGFGQGAMAPLCFAVLGDLFRPVERSRWVGLLNLPGGFVALVGPALCGWLVDHYSWRVFFVGLIPFILASLLGVAFGLPRVHRRSGKPIDVRGSILLTAAMTTTLVGLSSAGTAYAWLSVQVLGWMAASVLLWGAFLRREARAPEPILDPKVLLNRTFLTASLSAFTSFFGLLAVTAYLPLFLQGVQGEGAVVSGQVITPYSVLVAFMGVPAGLLLSRTRRYRWMYILGYGVLTIALFGLAAFHRGTSLAWAFTVSTVAGLGLGAIPTLNTLIVQYALPRRLLGAATGGIFFFVMLGRAVAPALLGAIMNTAYARALAAFLPDAAARSFDAATLASISDPRALLSNLAMDHLRTAVASAMGQDPTAYLGVLEAIRASLEAALRQVFLAGAITMLASFLLVLTIPELSLESEAPDGSYGVGSPT